MGNSRQEINETLQTPDAGKHLVILMPSGRRGYISHGRPVLEAARELGVEIESICAWRLTCGKCKIRVEEGNFQKHGITSSSAHISEPSQEELTLLHQMGSDSHRLSCSARVEGDLLITVPEESRAQKQVIRKSATERLIQIAPAIRQAYVTVDEAQLGEHRGDWGRLQAALAEQWNLADLSIDLHALRGLQNALRQGKWSVTVTLWHDREVIDIKPGYEEGVYGLAVDIGSTTLAGYLCDLRTGELLATESMMNPQVSFGEDLMSRISYAMSHADGLDKMHAAILEALNRLAANAARAAGIRARNIQEAVVAGNTTMIHIFMGINPVELGGAPFALANRDSIDVKARELGLRLHPGANVHILPAQAGHVGADNVAVLLAEEPYRQDQMTLIIDVGTNAEIDLGNQEKMLSASSPTGPAFEGGQISAGMRAAPGAIERVRIDPQTKIARFRVIGEEKWSDQWQIGLVTPLDSQPAHMAAGICGSGIIEAVAEMYLTGIINSDGRIIPDESNQRLLWHGRRGAYLLATPEQTSSGKPILITQEDIRNIQLAKAALYAGAKLLMNRSGVGQVNRIILAGAFGSYIDPKYALILGLIPDCSLERVYAVGNAAGDGARIALLNRHKRIEAQEIAHWIRYIETAVDPEFQKEFVDAMYLPHRRDPYPHLAGILPEATAVPHPRGERRRRTAHQVG